MYFGFRLEILAVGISINGEDSLFLSLSHIPSKNAASEMTSCRFYPQHHHHDKTIIVPINAGGQRPCPAEELQGFTVVLASTSCQQLAWKECTGNPPLPFIWEPDREILTRKLMRWPCSPVSLGLPGYLLLLQWGVFGI